MKFLQVDSLEIAKNKLKSCFEKMVIDIDTISIDKATGRVLAQDIISNEDIPSFYRSTVDGYAVKSQNTSAANETIPTFLTLIGEVIIGENCTKEIRNGESIYIPTGAMLPVGADAVVMVEHAELLDADTVAIYDSVPFGRSVVVPGEDIQKGQLVLNKGTKLTAAQIGALAACGIWEVEVYKPLNISIISTGDELIDVRDIIESGKVRDINSWAISSLATQAGFNVMYINKIQDDKDKFILEIEKLKASSHIIITSGGSSQGKKDITEEIFNKIATPGVMTHGLSIKPGKPTVVAYDDLSNTIFMGLPGHPVAALTVFQLLGIDTWNEITNQKPQNPIYARMQTNIPSSPGKTTTVIVQLMQGEDGYIAKPILGKSGMINIMAQGDGYIIIDANKEGLQKEEMVKVYHFGI